MAPHDECSLQRPGGAGDVRGLLSETVVMNHGPLDMELSRAGGADREEWTGGPSRAEGQALCKHLRLHVRRRNCDLRSEEACVRDSGGREERPYVPEARWRSSSGEVKTLDTKPSLELPDPTTTRGYH